MNIPKELFAVGSELLRNPIAFARNNQHRLKAFALRDQQWACLLQGSEQVGTWYLRPLCMAPALCESQQDSLSVLSDPMHKDVQLTRKLSNSLGLLPCSKPWMERGQPFLVASLDNLGAVLMVRCDALRLVAETLQDWGEPPESIAIDWQNQRNAIAAHIPEFSQLETAETFVSEDGTLFPIFLDSKVACQSVLGTIPCRDVSSLPLDATTFQDWPVVLASPKAHELLWSPAPDRVNRLTVATPKKPPRFRSLAIVCGLVISFAVAIYAASQFSTFDSARLEPPKIASTFADEHATSFENEESQINDLQVDELENAAMESAEASEITLLSIEQELKQDFDGFDQMPTLDASAIIADTLKISDSSHHEAWGNEAWGNIAANQESDGAQIKTLTSIGDTGEINKLGEIHSENGIIALNHLISFQSALWRESMVIGKPVVTKDCRCVIEIKRPEKLIIEPTSAVVIEGNGKQTWRVAIEDQGPELVVELTSKPGSRWQIIAAVGLRERIIDPPILLQPRDPQNVCNRLVAYSQWISQTIDTLQNSKTNKRDATNRNLTAEVKRLSAVQKEVTKAIERWRFIANLSHQFYDQVEMKLELHPAEKK